MWGALHPPPSSPSPSLSAAYLAFLVNELAGLFEVNVSLNTTPSSKLCGVNWVLAEGRLLTTPFCFRFSFPASLEPWLLVMLAEPVSSLPAHRTLQLGHTFSALSPHQDQWLLLLMETGPTPWPYVQGPIPCCLLPSLQLLVSPPPVSPPCLLQATMSSLFSDSLQPWFLMGRSEAPCPAWLCLPPLGPCSSHLSCL